MPKKTETTEFIRSNTIKEYINKIKKMRSSDDAVGLLLRRFNETIETVLTSAQELAKQNKRNTILEQDITTSMEKHLGKRDLTWEETSEQIIRQNPADLGKISQTINDYIQKHQK